MSHTRKITYFNKLSMSFASRGTDRYKKFFFGVSGPGSHGRLCIHLIASIDNSTNITGQQGGPIRRIHELFDARHMTDWIDGLNAVAHSNYLGLTQGCFYGMNLAIDIGLGNMVQINQRQVTNPASDQCLNCPGTDTTNANDHDMGGHDTVSASRTIESTQTRKPPIHAYENPLFETHQPLLGSDGSF